MPTPGEVKHFANGKIGRWDGQGWEEQDNPVAPQNPTRGFAETAVEDYGLPMAGAIIGGKTPLGKVGSGIGAGVGTAYGDLAKWLGNAAFDRPNPEGIPSPGQEAEKLATVSGLTTAGEYVIPPIMRGIGAVKNLLPKGSGILGGGGLGWLFGHPAAGAVAGAVTDAAPQVGKAIDYIGEPAAEGFARRTAGTVAPAAAPTDIASVVNNKYAEARAAGMSSEGARKAAGFGPANVKGGLDPRMNEVERAFSDVPDYLKKIYNHPIDSAVSGVKSAWETLDNFFATPEAPPPPTRPATPRSTAPLSYNPTAKEFERATPQAVEELNRIKYPEAYPEDPESWPRLRGWTQEEFDKATPEELDRWSHGLKNKEQWESLGKPRTPTMREILDKRAGVTKPPFESGAVEVKNPTWSETPSAPSKPAWRHPDPEIHSKLSSLSKTASPDLMDEITEVGNNYELAKQAGDTDAIKLYGKRLAELDRIGRTGQPYKPSGSTVTSRSPFPVEPSRNIVGARTKAALDALKKSKE